MYPNYGSAAKGSKRSRRPLKHLPKTYANRMSLPSNDPPPFYPILPISNTAMDNQDPSSSATNDNQTPPPVEFAASSLDNVEQTTYQQVGEKRMKTEYVSPGIGLGDVDAITKAAGGEGARIGATSKDENPECLALPEDKRHLTELHCFVRRHNVYLFCADADEVGVPKKGRKKTLVSGQVGIGCSHCRYSETKGKGCTYFPSSISGIYNATMIIQQRHFPVCPSVSKEIHVEYNKLKVLTARSASTKEYWVWAAKKVGLIDTNEGVFFHSNVNQTVDNHVIHPIVSFEKLRSLVESSDKIFATEYAYYVLSQMTTCHFTESDRLGKRKRHLIGFSGLACRYCYGGNGSGRFFPLTLKTFGDVSKSLHVLSNHLQKCPKCPQGMSARVKSLAELHEVEKVSQPFGTQKIFFDLIWKRLHPELHGGMPSAPDDGQSSPPLKSEEYPSPPSDSVQSSNQAQMPPTDTNVPSIPGERKMGAIKYPTRECLIPKKRYCVQSNVERSTISTDRYPGLPPLYPTERESTNPGEYYSETDMSAAMILATGFDRKRSKNESTVFEEV